MQVQLLSTLVAVCVATSGLASPLCSGQRQVNRQPSKRSSGDVVLDKRYSNSRWSFYDVGLGACGEVNVASDFIVALNSEQFGGGYPGVHCFESITLTYNGKSAQATIMDSCPGCPYAGLDLSRGLFDYFAPESVGIIYGEWNYNSGGATRRAAFAPTINFTDLVKN